MIPPHLFYQINPSCLDQNDCIPPKCGKLSEYHDSADTEVEDLSSRYMNGPIRQNVWGLGWEKRAGYLATTFAQYN